MSNVDVSNGQAPLQPNLPPQAGNDNISYTKALLILLALLVLLGSGGYALGKYKFWKVDAAPKLDQMAAIYSSRIESDPNNPGNFIQLGYVYFQKGEYDAAISNYKKALALDDKNYQAHYNLALAYDITDKKDRAVQEFQKAIEIAPKAGSAHLGLGMVYKSQNACDKAIQELELAYKANPGDVEVLYTLGTLQEKLGNTEEALKDYQQAYDVLPSFQKAKDAIDRLKAQKK